MALVFRRHSGQQRSGWRAFSCNGPAEPGQKTRLACRNLSWQPRLGTRKSYGSDLRVPCCRWYRRGSVALSQQRFTHQVFGARLSWAWGTNLDHQRQGQQRRTDTMRSRRTIFCRKNPWRSSAQFLAARSPGPWARELHSSLHNRHPSARLPGPIKGGRRSGLRSSICNGRRCALEILGLPEDGGGERPF